MSLEKISGQVSLIKNELRRKMKQLRKNFPTDQRISASNKIINRCLELELFKSANEIFSYVPTDDEVQIDPLLENLLLTGKNISIPYIILKSEMCATRINSLKNLVVGKFGIRSATEIQPVPASEIDLVIVPGLAFDHFGNRLGFGGGFYDKFLSNITAKKVALCFDFQLIDNVPIEPHDQKIDILITEKGEIFF